MKFRDLAAGPSPQLPLEAYTARRKVLAKKLGAGNTLVVATNLIHQYSNDVDYLYRPHSDFWYLTGFNEPGATLVLEGGSGRTSLFLRDRKKEAEIWTGRRLGVARAPAALGVDRAFAAEDLASRLPGVLGKSKVHAIADHDKATKSKVVKAAGTHLVKDPGTTQVGGAGSALLKRPGKKAGVRHGRQVLHEMRLRKEPAELKMLKRACDLGVDAHLEMAPAVKPGSMEFHVEADFVHHARHAGSTGVGYPSICGCGPNAAVLHYVSNLGGLRKGELFLVDAGCEWGYYTSDITRTYPVGGEWSRTQLACYELVLEAHQKALKQVKPGNVFRKPHETAVEVITAGLIDLGYIDGPFETALKQQTYRRFFMHGTSHWLGLDVHDAGGGVEDDGKPRKLEEGMCLTVEPGLYFNTDYATCPPGTAGIGIRIEDDVAVTEDGMRNLTKRLPVRPDEVADLVR